MPRPRSSSSTPLEPRPYQHPEVSSASPPEIGAQPHFKKKLPPETYRYDSSLSPELNWDTNPSREEGEALLATIQNATTLEEAQAAARKLARLSRPFLNWTGKAERLSFEVPTLPLFVHERLATSAILETLKSHKRDKQLSLMDDLFGVPERPLIDQVLRPYEHGPWVNRLVLGDSLLVMNSLLRYDGLGGQVQMIYMDPPYGVKFGSNFQPFVRKRDVKHNEDEDFTREPEMVQAYRDTWELGLHSYLTYLRDRLLLSRDLLKPEGSIFVQISDENLHHVRELMDEIFGAENFVAVITVKKTTGVSTNLLASTADYLIWYGKDVSRIKFRQLYTARSSTDESASRYDQVQLPDGTRRSLSTEEKNDPSILPAGSKRFRLDNLISSDFRPDTTVDFTFEGKVFHPGKSNHWKTSLSGLEKLGSTGRLMATGGRSLSYVRFLGDFPATTIANVWTDISGSIQSRSDPKIYVVQTSTATVERCMLMTTDPGDLVFDPTCGSGTTAYVAEQWGRRWVTCDTSRVPLALARQRILTATFPFYELKEEGRGPAGGFVYKRRQNQKGEEVGGIVPHITLKSIANEEPPTEEVLVDRPEVVKGIVRVSGPFTVQATIPAASGIDDDPGTPSEWGESFANHTERMTEVLRRAPVLRLVGNQSVTLRNIRPPAKTLMLSAEALLDDAEKGEQSVAIAFGPESGPISLRQAEEAWKEANLKGYSQLLLIGFGIDPKAREFVEQVGQLGIPATYLQATMDLQMGDLLKNLRSSQVFSVCGLPEIEVHQADKATWQVKLLGLDTFDPVTMETTPYKGDEVPAWFLDTDYNGLVFRVRQAFFPRTGAWENLKKALRAEFDDSVWEHLSGTTSAPFEAGEQRQIAVKVIDPRGNELTVVQSLEAK